MIGRTVSMGYKAHDAVVANFEWRHAIEAARLFSVLRGELRDRLAGQICDTGLADLLVGPIAGADETVSYALLPDGSKEAFVESAIFDEARAKFVAIASRLSDASFVHVRFGADFKREHGDPKIILHE